MTQNLSSITFLDNRLRLITTTTTTPPSSTTNTSSPQSIIESWSHIRADLGLVLLGDSGVGKSCIMLQIVRGQFDPTSKVTVGASFLSQTIALQYSTTVKFEIWDTAGQER
ncbi:hypothetical protein Droror1_Dr00017690 [Drosera rotundifolia]